MSQLILVCSINVEVVNGSCQVWCNDLLNGTKIWPHVCMHKAHGAWSIKEKWLYHKENRWSKHGEKKGTTSITYDNNEGERTLSSFASISNTITSPVIRLVQQVTLKFHNNSVIRLVQQVTLTFTIKVKMSWSTMSNIGLSLEHVMDL